MIKRFIGLIILLVGVGGVLLAAAGAIYLPQAIDNVATNLDETLLLTSDSLDNVGNTLLLAKTTIEDVSTSLDTVEMTLDDLGQSINNTTPLLDQVTAVTSHELPESIETLQTAIPDMAQVAAVVDDTLSTLNRFRIDESFLGIDINYNLGIDYNPEVPFDETVLSLGEGLEGLPGSLRSLQVYMNVTKSNLEEVSSGLFQIADDLGVVNGRIIEIDPLLNEYLRIVTQTNDNTRALRTEIGSQLETISTVATVLMIWLALSQLAPIYLGWELLANKRGSRDVKEQG